MFDPVCHVSCVLPAQSADLQAACLQEPGLLVNLLVGPRANRSTFHQLSLSIFDDLDLRQDGHTKASNFKLVSET